MWRLVINRSYYTFLGKIPTDRLFLMAVAVKQTLLLLVVFPLEVLWCCSLEVGKLLWIGVKEFFGSWLYVTQCLFGFRVRVIDNPKCSRAWLEEG